MVNNLPANAGDIRGVGLIPGSGRSPGGRLGNPLQYSCLENSMNTGAWQSTVRGLAKELDMTEHTHTGMVVHSSFKAINLVFLLFIKPV